MTRHLIHIGYPKAGSTFLQEWFGRHPELCYKHGGLGGFRDVYELARPGGGEAYKYFVTSGEALSAPHESAGGVRWGGEPEPHDPVKENQAKVCARLKSLFPASRVLIVTRGFRGIITSGYSQYVRAGGVEQLEGMCRTLAARACGACDHFDIDYLIGLYAEAFGEENLIVLPYELLRDDPARFLGILEEELGVVHVETDASRVNPSLSPEELYWYPLVSRAVMKIIKPLGPSRSRGVFRWYARQTFVGRLRTFVRLLALFKPGRKITGADFPTDVLRHCRGKATRLRGRPHYEPYAAEYLLTEELGG